MTMRTSCSATWIARAWRAGLTTMLGVLLAPAAGAFALPGDPAIEPLSPAEGAVVRVSGDVLSVSFRCPDYRQEVYGDADDPITTRGEASDYEVRFSASAALGPDGLLAQKSFGSDSGARAGADPASCTSELSGNGGVNDPTRVGGRVFWQAYRPCAGCQPTRHEVAPVRSFVARVSIAATLELPKRLYAGYLGVFSVKSPATFNGAEVTLQRRVGSRWTSVTRESYRSDATELIAKLPAGRHSLRGLITAGGSTFPTPTRSVTVLREGKRSTSSRDDGRYADVKAAANSTLAFTVANGGRSLRAFKASVTTFCFGPTIESNRLFLVFALLNTVRVAPDGAVVGLLETKKGGRELLTGRVRGGRFVGEIEVGLSTCNGTRKFTAARR